MTLVQQRSGRTSKYCLEVSPHRVRIGCRLWKMNILPVRYCKFSEQLPNLNNLAFRRPRVRITFSKLYREKFYDKNSHVLASPEGSL